MQRCASVRIATQRAGGRFARSGEPHRRPLRRVGSPPLVAAVLRSNPSLRRLLGAWLQSCLGTGAGYVALLVLTLRYLHTSWAVAGVLLADFLPAIAFGSWFGALADRYPRRRLVVSANLLQAAAWAGLAVTHGPGPIPPLAL